MVELAERLIGKGHDVRIYDSNVALSRLIGANRAYIEDHLPHIGELLTSDIEAVLAHGEVFIAGTTDADRRRRRSTGSARIGRSSTSSACPAPPSGVSAPGMWESAGDGARLPRHVLILVENLSVPFDRRVWQESRALVDAGIRSR